ncbi:hypothetical protein TNCV_2493191 [Trichonephila clavipes]|uniref:Uncharacterized protein n=1 Tax=Trichonephila clavipes TaxID=2585209 RepID=A0A8X6V997_TRICX|nr:hypothetical protein TNCV_2493191 [Trichonephila clavipes]
MHVKSVKAQSHPVGVVWKFGEVVQAFPGKSHVRRGGRGRLVDKQSDRGWQSVLKNVVKKRLSRCIINRNVANYILLSAAEYSARSLYAYKYPFGLFCVIMLSSTQLLKNLAFSVKRSGWIFNAYGRSVNIQI